MRRRWQIVVTPLVLALLAALAWLVAWLVFGAANPALVIDRPAAVRLKLPRAQAPVFTSFDVLLRLTQPMRRGERLRITQGHVLGREVLADDVLRYRLPDWQTQNPSAENYLTISGPSYPLATSQVRGVEGSSTLVTPSRDLPSGTTLTLRFGDRSLGSPGQRIPPYPLQHMLILALERQAGTEIATLPLEIQGESVDRLLVVAEATPTTQDLMLSIAAMQGGHDDQPEAPVRSVGGTVALTLDGGSVAPAEVQLVDGCFRGRVHVSRESGMIEAALQDAPARGSSNPYRQARDGQHLYFGSLHNHSAVGGHAAGIPEQAFAYARDITRLDFFALTEHAGAPHFHWPELRALPDRYQVPQTFVTFAGYEWSQPDVGHRHVVLRDARDSVACCPGGADEGGERNANTLEDFLGASGPGHDPNALVVCHHTALKTSEASSAYDWGDTWHAPRQLMAEWFSWHGSSLWPEPELALDGRADKTLPAGHGSYLIEALRAGRILGIDADGDQHLARPGSPIGVQRALGQRYARHGLTVVWARALSREAIFGALEQRHCYGTTGARIFLRFDADGAPMGSVLEAGKPVPLQVEVHGTQDLDRVVLHQRQPEPLAEHHPEGTSFSTTVTITPQPGDFVFVVVRQRDGHEACSSPIFFTERGATR